MKVIGTRSRQNWDRARRASSDIVGVVTLRGFQWRNPRGLSCLWWSELEVPLVLLYIA